MVIFLSLMVAFFGTIAFAQRLRINALEEDLGVAKERERAARKMLAEDDDEDDEDL
jgi:hypothetical protein